MKVKNKVTKEKLDAEIEDVRGLGLMILARIIARMHRTKVLNEANDNKNGDEGESHDER